MRRSTAIPKYWPALLAGCLALGALALLWRVSDTPLVLGALVRYDALSAFFIFALFGGSTLVLAARPAGLPGGWPRLIAAAGALVLAYSTTLTLAIAGAYLALALLIAHWKVAQEQESQATPANRIVGALRRAATAAPSVLAAICLLLGYAALALRGAARYDERTAGAALDSFAFWFVLLAALLACAPLFRASKGQAELLGFAWLYPLARLYSLGPWNSGWSFAALLLGGALALWCAAEALRQPGAAARHAHIRSVYLALALAGLGLSNSTGVVAACYGILAYLVLCVGYGNREGSSEGAEASALPDLFPWLLSSAVPLTAPFVAAWMLMGAGVAGGVALLAGVAWLAALLHGLATALWDSSEPAHRPLRIAGAASIALGVGAPLLVRWLILPVVAQLQGGLTPFGDLNIWPWVGLAASESAHTQVTTLPSIAIALLMLVLGALVYVVARLREISRSNWSGEQPEPAVSPAVLRYLLDEVPWLGGLLGSNPHSQRHPGDSE